MADGGASWSALCSRSGFVCLPPLGLLSLRSGCFTSTYHGCFGLSSFIKGSGVSESLWCFLSRGGSTLLQRVHEGERMYPPLGSTGWWEPGDQTHNDLLLTGAKVLANINTDAYNHSVSLSCFTQLDPENILFLLTSAYITLHLLKAALQSSAFKMQETATACLPPGR